MDRPLIPEVRTEAAPPGRTVSYTVRLDLFEGPLDLLLYLIRKDEIEIADIPIAHITEQYLAHVQQLEVLELDAAGEYLLMAATLLRIKSRLLLPRPVFGEEADEDPRRDLAAQLEEYRKYKALAERFGDLAEQRRLRFDFVPAQPLDSLRSREEIFQLDFPDLLGALRDVMALVAEREARHRVELENVSIEDKMALIRARLARGERLVFRDLLAEAPTRLHVIVTFMALLEMVKYGELRVEQEGRCGEIWISAATPAAAPLAQAAGA
ncbi:segregation/condensation protein A [bacterium]|nr:segregation/condensation protein A [bacterium]